MVASVRTRPTLPAPDWRLVGPWYRWARPGLPEDGRVSRPAIQMFAGDDFISDFLAQPQRSLKFDPLIDVVNGYHLASAAPGGTLAGKFASLFAVNAQGRPAAAGEPRFRARLAPGSLRKLYQPTHDRHYLVCCELHCEQPGFPRVDRRQVCQAGFVIRRRRSVLPPQLAAATIKAQTDPVRAAEADLLDLVQLAATAEDPASSPALAGNARARQQKLVTEAGLADWSALLALRRAEADRLRSALDAWYREQGVRVDIEGWFPSDRNGRNGPGEWRLLDEPACAADPAISGEAVQPLFALVPDPREPDHDAAGRTLYYGTIPTTSLAHDARGAPRLDDRNTYEIRCFVRDHHAAPARAGKQPDCCGPVVWSAPTEAFRLAAPFDVLGSANRPVTIKMPDLRELAAQAAARPRGSLSPVRFVQPQHLSPSVKDKGASGGNMGGEAICSFSIPLITIIALFVLNLFLPIVVFIFQLWFLLVFRFCIPPQIKFSADVDAALAATPPGVDLDADFAVAVSGIPQTAAALNAALNGSMKTRIRQDTGAEEDPDLSGFSNNALGPLDQSLQDAAERVPPPPTADPDTTSDALASTLPASGRTLIYEDPVSPVWPGPGARA